MKKLSLMLLCCISLNASEILQYDGETVGYFEGTKIIRYIDKKYNIVCYQYTPEVIKTTHSSYNDKSSTTFNGDLGSLSCVKLFPFGK